MMDMEQEIGALEDRLETVEAQRDELLDLLEELIGGGFHSLDRWALEASGTVESMRRSIRR